MPIIHTTRYNGNHTKSEYNEIIKTILGKSINKLSINVAATCWLRFKCLVEAFLKLDTVLHVTIYTDVFISPYPTVLLVYYIFR